MIRMHKVRIVFIIIAVILIGCKNNTDLDSSSDNDTEEKDMEVSVEVEEDESEIQLSSYAEEIGFSLITPTKSELNAQTTVDIQGEIEKSPELTGDLIWIVITPNHQVDELVQDDFNYYIPINEGKFSKELVMHHGEGEYEVSVRVPSNKSEEEGNFYEATNFVVINEDPTIQREVEITQYGVENKIELSNPLLGLQDASGSVNVEGTVPDGYLGDMVLFQVEKENESKQVILPVKNHTFSGDVPLYFGEGVHYIRIQLFNGEDELYYDSATFYADNQTATAFAEMETYKTYTEHGITLYEPTWKAESEWNQVEYPIAGEIDPTLPGADKISHVIVTMNYKDENLESGYLIPVENYKFEGNAYFRFGPGQYEVMVNIPSMEQHDQSMFYFQAIAKVVHHVSNVSDQRDLLPSRGIESNHPTIIQQAESITSGINNERDKAKAIFEFVAKHVAYDVEKAENDIFNIGDSALTVLESGIGICQDYAFLATALLRATGMEAHYVEGYAGERHAWVEVKVDRDWIEMDPTWGAGYVQDGQFHFNYNEDYFDPDPAFLAETHTRDGIMY
ncbi:hypothetical protein GMD78_09215 [Ornithinibacillus sp. L9]|uniref:Transglutaminase-like domain-containing protein n=1 Tax=Ornithinibacillus caprae TaxID=2678566 RepID=A0A6N8FMK1_9BACI|nr:transglutaminase domain-containing protein [Ornithinibacillus caprae]MUK88568.1 hypothetical protein [Ornithinibacillus caprae]